MAAGDDPFGLARFTRAQEDSYDRALSELRGGKKRSHWMWYVFPQFIGLGASPMAREFAIRSREEAEAYLAHPVLGERLRECAVALLAHGDRSAREILGSPDDLKLRSSATLFAEVSSDPTFQRLLDRFYGGERDAETRRIASAGRGSVPTRRSLTSSGVAMRAAWRARPAGA